MKLYKYQEGSPLNYFQTKKQIEIPENYSNIQIRAMWVSNVVNIDLPTVEDIDIYQQKVIKMLETCLEFNINTIFFQVRTNNDAFYKSSLNPYSRYFTGKEGKEAPFDVFKWVLEEAKKRKIDCHAWCNPYRISMDGKLSIEDYLETCDDLNFAKQNPQHIILAKNGQLILNPGKQAVKDFIVKSMVEIVKNYDVAGIHFDDYFYPYGGLKDDQADASELNDQDLPLGDFRRQQVNDIVREVYQAIKSVNSDLKFGISPFGIWKNQKPNEFGSNTDLACTESYYALYADSLSWINEGIIDYIVPQIYWPFGHKIAPFADICDFWVQVCQGKDVDLYIGHGAYRLGEEGDFSNKMEIANQVKYTNQFDVIKGNVFFTYKNFIEQKAAYAGMQVLKKLLNGENI